MSTDNATSDSTRTVQHGLSEKGLKAGSVGLIGAVVIGVSCIAPAYTLTAALGPTVAEVGVQLPAIFLVGFIPMLLVALGYRELLAHLDGELEEGEAFELIARRTRQFAVRQERWFRRDPPRDVARPR